MKTVRGILAAKKHRLLTIAPKASVLEALNVMAEHDIGAVVVTDGVNLVGILSERDYARRVTLRGRTARDTTVVEVMTANVVCVRPEQTVQECMALMTDRHIRHLPVTEDGKLVGVISIGDVVKEVIAEQQFTIRQLENYIQS